MKKRTVPNVKRVKRPDLDRVGPIRQFSGIFGSGDQAAKSASRRSRPGPPRNGGDDGVARGVAMGYEVIDAYVRQGEEFARKVYGPQVGGARPANGSPAGVDPSGIQLTASRLIDVASDFVAAWMDLAQSAGQSRPGRAPRSDVPGFESNQVHSETAASGAERRPPEPPAPPGPVTLVVQSRQPVQVSIDIRPGDGAVATHDLRAADPNVPRIDGVTVERTGAGAIVRLRVPDGQPPGVYSGIVVEEQTNLPVGTLCVVVLSPDKPS